MHDTAPDAARPPVNRLEGHRMTVLMYSQHSVGMGHLVRSLALARALAERARVVVANGGPMPAGVAWPMNIARVDLPPLGMNADAQLVSLVPGADVERVLADRRGRLMSLLDEQRPDVIVVELFPFGRRKFAPELVPWLEAARARRPAPLIVSSVRDLLVTARPGQQAFDDRVAEWVTHLVDLVLVHADERFARLEESFRPTTPCAVPVVHTGFVVRPAGAPPSPTVARHGVLVSAGGGMVGELLFEQALAAQRELWHDDGLTMTIVAGPLLPDAAWARLAREALGHEGLVLLRRVDNLADLLRGAAVSVSQCGYNTALELVETETPALVVPYARGRENEQQRRAERLAAFGCVHVLPESDLSAQRLSGAIRTVLGSTPSRAALNVDGARASVDAIERHLRARRTRAASGPSHRGTRPASAAPALERARAVLDARDTTLQVFFRDDDAGWDQARLVKLLEVFDRARCPLDLAVIPAETTRELARQLLLRRTHASARLGLHQHGWAHLNHEPLGRKSEFGDSRSLGAIRLDLSMGRQVLLDRFGDALDAIWTPPWNRCVAAVGPLLVEHGVRTLSRDTSAGTMAVAGLRECPVTFDWQKRPRGRWSTPGDPITRLLGHLGSNMPLGVLLHHQTLDDRGLDELAGVLAVLTAHPRVRCEPLEAVAGVDVRHPSNAMVEVRR